MRRRSRRCPLTPPTKIPRLVTALAIATTIGLAWGICDNDFAAAPEPILSHAGPIIEKQAPPAESNGFNAEAFLAEFTRSEVGLQTRIQWRDDLLQAATQPYRNHLLQARQLTDGFAAELTTFRNTLHMGSLAVTDYVQSEHRAQAFAEGVFRAEVNPEWHVAAAGSEAQTAIEATCRQHADARRSRLREALIRSGIDPARLAQITPDHQKTVAERAGRSIGTEAAAGSASGVTTSVAIGVLSGVGTGAVLVAGGLALSPETLGASAVAGTVAGIGWMYIDGRRNRTALEYEANQALFRLEEELVANVTAQIERDASTVMAQWEQEDRILIAPLDGVAVRTP